MKNFSLYTRTFIALLALSLSFVACKDDDDDTPVMPLYSLDENPLGQSYEYWIIDWWKFLMSHDCNTLPTASEEPQNGSVVYLSGGIETYEQYVTIRSDQSLLTPILNYINDFPCPDTAFHPAPGQSLEDFLVEGAIGFMDYAADMELILDGVTYPTTEAHRMHTGLFYFTGNPDIANCVDPCVTGESQAAASDGYWYMIKPLSKGQHTLIVKGKLVFPDATYENHGTFHITVN